MEAKKLEMIARIEKYIKSKGYGIDTPMCYSVGHTFKDGRYLWGISWDQNTKDRGKLFFEIAEKGSRDHEEILAEDIDIDELEAIVKNKKMPICYGFVNKEIWTGLRDDLEFGGTNYEEEKYLSWGQQNIWLVIDNTRHLYYKALRILQDYPAMGVDKLNDYFDAKRSEILDLAMSAVSELRKTSGEDEPECLADETALSILTAVKCVMKDIALCHNML